MAPAGDCPGEGDADAVGGADVAGGSLTGHEGASGVIDGAFEEDIAVVGLLAHDADAVLAAVAAEVLVAIEGAGHEGEVLAVDFFVVGAVEGGDVAFADPGDDAVFDDDAGGGDGVCAGAVDKVNVADDENSCRYRASKGEISVGDGAIVSVPQCRVNRGGREEDWERG